MFKVIAWLVWSIESHRSRQRAIEKNYLLPLRSYGLRWEQDNVV